MIVPGIVRKIELTKIPNMELTLFMLTCCCIGLEQYEIHILHKVEKIDIIKNVFKLFSVETLAEIIDIPNVFLVETTETGIPKILEIGYLGETVFVGEAKQTAIVISSGVERG